MRGMIFLCLMDVWQEWSTMGKVFWVLRRRGLAVDTDFLFILFFFLAHRYTAFCCLMICPVYLPQGTAYKTVLSKSSTYRYNASERIPQILIERKVPKMFSNEVVISVIFNVKQFSVNKITEDYSPIAQNHSMYTMNYHEKWIPFLKTIKEN